MSVIYADVSEASRFITHYLLFMIYSSYRFEILFPEM